MKKLTHSNLKLLALFVMCLLPGRALGGDREETLDLFGIWQTQSVSVGRAAKPLSQTPENVTVVTAAEIESLNAHTLADVLATIPGINMDYRGGPGSASNTYIQSYYTKQILVLIDGMSQNNISDSYSDVGLVPVQQIERIEVIKGAASAAWGQALAGVINVITKSPEPGRPASGAAAISNGERSTTDTRGELTGSSGRIGYYLSGGYLGSSGLLPNNAIYSSNGHAKLTLDLPGQSSLAASLSYARANRGDFIIPGSIKGNDSVSYLSASLGYRRPLTEGLELELSTRYSQRRMQITIEQTNDSTLVQQTRPRERVTGGSIKLVWRRDHHLLVAGSDYEHAELDSKDSLLKADFVNRSVDRWGAYLNHTLSAGPAVVSSGIRFDRTQSSGDQVSPSLGVTWQLNDTTLVRGYTAIGYSLPALMLEHGSEKAWTSQCGIESTAVPNLWLKGTFFRNELWDVAEYESPTKTWSSMHFLALGTELEARTVPLLHTSMGANYTFVDTTRSNDGSQVKGLPRHTLQLALRYDDQRLRGVLTGRHIWWNATPISHGRYNGLVWDLHLGARLYRQGNTELELFFSGRNLFNTSQYQDEIYRNTGRWFDGGMRVRF